MKIAFVWDWEFVPEQALTWEDGLAAAIRELQRRGHSVTVITIGNYAKVQHHYFEMTVVELENITRLVSDLAPDVILHWADMTRPSARKLVELGVPMAICFAGGEALGENVELFDHIFVESDVYLQMLTEHGYKSSIAFGTNTDLFNPTRQNKMFDTIFPATFALWKRHELYAEAVRGYKAIACGYMYDKHEQECWQVCLDNGVMILPHVSAKVLRYLYAASGVCVIPSLSSGGSQRTVLEAMAMNLPLVVCDSDKFDYVDGQDVIRVDPTVNDIREAVGQSLVKSVDTRPFVLDCWSHITYADAIEKGLHEII